MDLAGKRKNSPFVSPWFEPKFPNRSALLSTPNFCPSGLYSYAIRATLCTFDLYQLSWWKGFLNGPILFFCLFSSFQHVTIQIRIDKSVDGVLGIRTRGGRMEDADKSTELRQWKVFVCIKQKPLIQRKSKLIVSNWLTTTTVYWPF